MIMTVDSLILLCDKCRRPADIRLFARNAQSGLDRLGNFCFHCELAVCQATPNRYGFVGYGMGRLSNSPATAPAPAPTPVTVPPTTPSTPAVEAGGTVTEPAKVLRPGPQLPEVDWDRVRALVRMNRSSREIARILSEEDGVNVSYRTIARRLEETAPRQQKLSI